MSSNRKYQSDKLTESYHLVPLLPAGDCIQNRNLFDVLMFVWPSQAPQTKLSSGPVHVSSLKAAGSGRKKTLAIRFGMQNMAATNIRLGCYLIKRYEKI